MTGFDYFVQYSWQGAAFGSVVYIIGVISGIGLRWLEEHIKPKD